MWPPAGWPHSRAGLIPKSTLATQTELYGGKKKSKVWWIGRVGGIERNWGVIMIQVRCVKFSRVNRNSTSKSTFNLWQIKKDPMHLWNKTRISQLRKHIWVYLENSPWKYDFIYLINLLTHLPIHSKPSFIMYIKLSKAFCILI